MAHGFEKRAIQFEFEEVPGALSYEIEITPKSKKTNLGGLTKKIQIKTLRPEFEGKLFAGIYNLRIRALDRRKVPGVWSEEMILKVPLEQAQGIAPKAQERIPGKDLKEETVQFKWKSVPGADEYEISVRDKDKLIRKTTSDLEIKLDLPVGRRFEWSVAPRLNSETLNDELKNSEFFLMGGQLPVPEVQDVDLEKNSKIQWVSDPKTEFSEFQISRFEASTQKWVPTVTEKNFIKSEFDFDKAQPTGLYRIRLQSGAEAYQKSKVTTQEFAHGIDKDTNSEDLRPNRLFPRVSMLEASLSFSNTSISFQEVSSSSTQTNSTDFVGLQLNYRKFKKNSNWGWGGSYGFKTFKYAGQDANLNNLAGLAFYRKKIKEPWQYTLASGIFYREKQAQSGVATSNSQVTLPSISEYGFLLGAELSYGLRPKWSLRSQLNFELTLGGSASDLNVKNSTSRQFYLWADYFGWSGLRASGGLMSFKTRNSYEVSGVSTDNSLDENGLALALAKQF